MLKIDKQIMTIILSILILKWNQCQPKIIKLYPHLLVSKG